MNLLSFNQTPIGAHLVPIINTAISDLSATGKGVIAYPGIETLIGQSEITYTDNSKTITAFDSDFMGVTVSANTNLFVNQCIKIGGKVCVITEIDGTSVKIDRKLTTLKAGDSLAESVYYSAYRMDENAKPENAIEQFFESYATYFYIEVVEGGVDGQINVVFVNGVEFTDYKSNTNISTKPISMVKPNAANTVGSIYVFKAF